MDVIEVPEIMETQPGSNVVIRGASIQLVALLESGDLDCAFEYESVARQHGLEYVLLPASIDLGEESLRDCTAPSRSSWTSAASPVCGPCFGRRHPLRLHHPGERSRPRVGAEFAAFLLGPEGRRILEADHQPVLAPPELDDPAAAPEEVRRACAGSR